MAWSTFSRRFDRPHVEPRTLGVLALLVLVELVLVELYLTRTPVRVFDPMVYVYPFVWIDASVLALLASRRPTGSARDRALAVAVGVGYLLILGYFGGLFGLGGEHVPLQVDWHLPPGYGPALLYAGPSLRLVLEPYKVVGYLTLAYFVYATVLDTAVGRASASGLVGVFSCVSCMWPVLGTVATTLFGSGSAVAAVALSQSYPLGTLVFLSALALLYYRPLF